MPTPWLGSRDPRNPQTGGIDRSSVRHRRRRSSLSSMPLAAAGTAAGRPRLTHAWGRRPPSLHTRCTSHCLIPMLMRVCGFTACPSRRCPSPARSPDPPAVLVLVQWSWEGVPVGRADRARSRTVEPDSAHDRGRGAPPRASTTRSPGLLGSLRHRVAPLVHS